MIPSQFQSLANHLWQSTLFAVAAGLPTLAFRRNRAQTRHWLWLAASVKFLMPFSLLVDMGERLGQHTALAISSPGFAYTIAQASQPFTGPIPLSPAPAPLSSPANWLATVTCAVWAVGFMTLICFWWRRWRSLRVMMRNASPLDLQIGIQAMTSAAFAEPGVFGIRKPILLLPADITERLTFPQLDAIVAHELCHMRRRDNLATAVHMSVEAVFWFHPLVWWLGARLMEERERACDEEVLLTGSEPQTYAEGILKVCELYLESPLACVSGVTGANLRRRIEEIMATRIALRLTFARKALLAAAGVATLAAPILIGVLNAPAIEAQTAAPSTPRFEVVSIKPCKIEPGQLREPLHLSPGRLRVGCDLLADDTDHGLIQGAYVGPRRRNEQFLVLPIKGGPQWIRTQMFQIEAKTEGNPSKEMMEGPMLRALLEDRFKLKIHRETREGPVYALTRASARLKLKPFPEGSCVQIVTRPAPPAPSGQRYCKDLISFGGSIDAEGSTLTDFSKMLSLILDRPVIDKTGISGRFTIHLEFARDQATGRLPEEPFPNGLIAAPPDPNRSTIFVAIQEQLGLKLTSARGPVEFLVIDHIEKPSEN